MKLFVPIVCVLFAAGCGKTPPAAQDSPSPSPSRSGEIAIAPDSPKMREIRVHAVGEAEVPLDVVEAPGQLEVNPNRLGRVVTPVEGRVTNVFVRLGDAVKQDQPVAEIQSPDGDVAISAYLQADANLGQMRANLLKAQADRDRTRDLVEHQAMAQKELLNAENALAQAKAMVDQAAAGREQALRRLQILGLKPGEFGQRITLRAPVSGKVLELDTVPGEWRNDTNQALMSIADLSTVWVASDVPETAIRSIRMGELLELSLAAFPDETFRAHVTRVADTVDRATRTIKVWAELDNRAGRFRPEMFCRIRHVESTRRLPVVPAAALVQTEGRTAVYRETAPGRFVAVPVETAARVGNDVPIVSGLEAGARIVTDGVMLLRGN
jgi:cobalt-zinc-cadmium efflux system membrane fusion protein